MDISAYQHMNIRMSTRGKRPLRNLTPSDKVRAIQRIHNGETKASVSRDIGVPESTLRGWCKNEQKLRFMCRQMGADHAGVAARLENLPAEKRAKYDTGLGAVGVGGFPSIPNFENIAFNRLPLNPMDFGGNNGALLSKFCMNNFEKQKGGMAPMNKSGINPLLAARAGAAAADCAQLPFMQNPNLLALLNSNLWSSLGAENILTNSSNTVNSGNNNSASSNNNNNNTNNNNNNKSTKKSNELANSSNGMVSGDKLATTQPALSVKNWAKDFAEHVESKEHNRNDTNNNDVKSGASGASAAAIGDTGVFPLLFPGGMPAVPSIVNGQESNNTALMEWCKMFNASINFLALAAAAASLQQQPPMPFTADSSDSNSNSLGTTTSTTAACNADNLLYKQLTQAADTANKSAHLYNDLSNDCAYESEPEDLSVRSTTSKVSSPAYSRSHSPAKSNTSRSSLNSDQE